jgi:D-serine dehydratase
MYPPQSRGSAVSTPPHDETPYDIAAVDALAHVVVPAGTKGFEGATGAQLAGTALFDGMFTFPLLTVRASAVAHNIAQLARFCADHDVALAPHAKTTMAPHLFAAQLDAGAWGLTVATIGQVRVCRDFGVRRVLLANELVDPAGIAWLAGEMRSHPEFDLCCYVDSLDGVRLLDAALAEADPGRPLGVLVELGHDGGRTGCRTVEAARTVAAAVDATSTLRVVGVAGYEGGIAHDRSPASLAAVHAFCRRLADFAAEVGGGPGSSQRPIVTAGGSAFPDVVAEALADVTGWATVILRSGCYVTHDDGEYARISPFTEQAGSPYALTAALELWAPVLSRPEPGLALLGVGRRDVGFDQGYPVPRTRRTSAGTAGASAAESLLTGVVTALNDQHAYLELSPETELAVGDLVALGISHPCTTIDRWRYLVEVDDDDFVTRILPTYF